MGIQHVGSNVNLLFQSKSMTFTPDQFNKVFRERGFSATQGIAPISQNPNAKPIPTVYFSKDNLIVLYNPVEFLVLFQIINTLDFSQLYDNEIKPILTSLNFVPEIVSMMGLECNTKITSIKSPRKSLTSLLKQEFRDHLAEILGISNLNIFTLRLIGGDDKIENINVAIEPLATDLDKIYHVSFSYRTVDNSKFNEFVSRFGEDMIKNIIEETDKYE